MHISRCTRVLAQKLCVHADITLKFMYRHKQVFFGDFLGTSKYNMGKGGPKSMQRDMEGHKYVINQVCKRNYNRYEIIVGSYYPSH